MKFTQSLVLLVAALAISTNAQFTSFSVTNNADGNACATNAQTVELDACTPGCGTNIEIVKSDTVDSFSFSTYSDVACANIDGSANTIKCVDDKTPETFGSYSILCVGSPTPTPAESSSKEASSSSKEASSSSKEASSSSKEASSSSKEASSSKSSSEAPTDTPTPTQTSTPTNTPSGTPSNTPSSTPKDDSSSASTVISSLSVIAVSVIAALL